MFGIKDQSATDSSVRSLAEDAVFIGWQPNGSGEAFPLYNVTASGPLNGSTVSDQTLRAQNLRIPETPPCKLR